MVKGHGLHFLGLNLWINPEIMPWKEQTTMEQKVEFIGHSL